MDSIVEGLFPRSQITWRTENQIAENTKELFEATIALPNNKIPGPERVSTEMLKEVIKHKPEVFLNVFNKCVIQDYFPKRLKITRLVLLRKGDKSLTNPSLYRPLCMINTTGKILEKILDNRLRQYLEEKNEYIETQYGFRKEKSTIDALSRLNNIVKANGKKVYRNAHGRCKITFNIIPWGKILEAVSNKTIFTCLCQLIDSYFKDRKLRFTTEVKPRLH